MKLFKHSEFNNLYQLHELTEEQLIALYSMCVNYKGLIAQMLQSPDRILLKTAPGVDAKTVRSNLKLQNDTCDEYIALWKQTINPQPSKKSQN
jgi:hypothetical protein